MLFIKIFMLMIIHWNITPTSSLNCSPETQHSQNTSRYSWLQDLLQKNNITIQASTIKELRIDWFTMTQVLACKKRTITICFIDGAGPQGNYNLQNIHLPQSLKEKKRRYASLESLIHKKCPPPLNNKVRYGSTYLGLFSTEGAGKAPLPLKYHSLKGSPVIFYPYCISPQQHIKKLPSTWQEEELYKVAQAQLCCSLFAKAQLPKTPKKRKEMKQHLFSFSLQRTKALQNQVEMLLQIAEKYQTNLPQNWLSTVAKNTYILGEELGIAGPRPTSWQKMMDCVKQVFCKIYSIDKEKPFLASFYHSIQKEDFPKEAVSIGYKLCNLQTISELLQPKIVKGLAKEYSFFSYHYAKAQELQGTGATGHVHPSSEELQLDEKGLYIRTPFLLAYDYRIYPVARNYIFPIMQAVRKKTLTVEKAQILLQALFQGQGEYDEGAFVHSHNKGRVSTCRIRTDVPLQGCL